MLAIDLREKRPCDTIATLPHGYRLQPTYFMQRSCLPHKNPNLFLLELSHLASSEQSQPSERFILPPPDHRQPAASLTLKLLSLCPSSLDIWKSCVACWLRRAIDAGLADQKHHPSSTSPISANSQSLDWTGVNWIKVRWWDHCRGKSTIL